MLYSKSVRYLKECVLLASTLRLTGGTFTKSRGLLVSERGGKGGKKRWNREGRGGGKEKTTILRYLQLKCTRMCTSILHAPRKAVIINNNYY